jgi:RNA polymerase sigma factor (sigma-70 family)
LYNTGWSEKLSLYEEWYNRDMPSLFGYLFYQTQDQHTAQDLTSAACLRALERLEQYDPNRGKLKDWIFGIARNQLLEHFRSQRRRPPSIALTDAMECLAAVDEIELEYDEKEAFLEIISHLDELNEREREIISLRYGADLSNAEIASMLKITNNHVAVLLRRAVEKLKDKMEARVHHVS